MLRTFFLALLTLSLATPVLGEATLDTYDDFRGRADFNEYALGMGAALFMVNAEMVAKKQPPLFCPGDHVYGYGYLTILDNEVAFLRHARKGTRDREDPDLTTVMLRGLQRSFPCGEGATSSLQADELRKTAYLVRKYDYLVGDIPHVGHDPGFRRAVFGIAQGIFDLNARLIERDEQPLFCVPADVALDRDALVDLIVFQQYHAPDSTPQLARAMREEPLASALLDALIAMFPCQVPGTSEGRLVEVGGANDLEPLIVDNYDAIMNGPNRMGRFGAPTLGNVMRQAAVAFEDANRILNERGQTPFFCLRDTAPREYDFRESEAEGLMKEEILNAAEAEPGVPNPIGTRPIFSVLLDGLIRIHECDENGLP